MTKKFAYIVFGIDPDKLSSILYPMDEIIFTNNLQEAKDNYLESTVDKDFLEKNQDKIKMIEKELSDIFIDNKEIDFVEKKLEEERNRIQQLLKEVGIEAEVGVAGVFDRGMGGYHSWEFGIDFKPKSLMELSKEYIESGVDFD